MIILTIILLNLILFNLKWIQTKEIETNKQCLIHNQEYSHEYLYNTDEFSAAHIKRNVFTYPLNKIKDYEKISWTFLPSIFEIGEKNTTYYMIQSLKYDHEYLCGTNEHELMSPYRRLIKRLKLTDVKKRAHLICHWKIENEKSNNLTNNIVNMLFDEPLYAAAGFFSVERNKRSVYLWRGKRNLHSKKFKWMIDCSKGEYLLSK